MANLAAPSTISRGSRWSLVSFDTRPFGAGGTFRASSDLGHSYDFNPGSGNQTHTLNWFGITTLTINRINPSAGSYDFDNVVYSNSVLPATFLAIAGKYTPQGVSLSWTTEETEAVDYYQVQRLNAAEVFETIATLSRQEQGQLTTATYHYLDPLVPTGQATYRIRQLDVDGTETYSPIVEILTTPADQLRWYWTDTETLRLTGSSGQGELQTMTGVSVRAFEIPEGGGSIDLTGLPSGMYLLRHRGPGGQVQYHRLSKP